MRTLLTFIVAAGMLQATPKQEIKGSKLIQHLEHKAGLVLIATKSGGTVRGLLEKVAGNELSIRTKTSVIKLPISDVLVVRLYEEVPARRLKNWRRHYGNSARRSARLIFSAGTVLGLVHAGVSAGAAVVSMPFCALGDLMMAVDWERPDRVYRVV